MKQSATGHLTLSTIPKSNCKRMKMRRKDTQRGCRVARGTAVKVPLHVKAPKDNQLHRANLWWTASPEFLVASPFAPAIEGGRDPEAILPRFVEF